ncbi:MAG: hypothetical protein C5B53_13855, partial [Candidatus Melainabacteria bacterium]
MLGGGGEPAAPESGYGFQSTPPNPASTVLGQTNYVYGTEADSRSNNTAPSQENSLRRGLHSPLLDGDGAASQLEGPPRSQSAFPHRQTENLSNPAGESKPVRPNKFLRSPLLSGGYEDDLEAEPHSQQFTQARGASSSIPERSGRLHSPALDGPYGAGNQIEPDDYYASEEINDPNILRSPLLAARVPLQDKPAPAKTPQPPPELKPPSVGREATAQAPGVTPSLNAPPAISGNVSASPQGAAPPPAGSFASSKPVSPPPQMISPPKVEPPKVEPPKVEPPKVEPP